MENGRNQAVKHAKKKDIVPILLQYVSQFKCQNAPQRESSQEIGAVRLNLSQLISIVDHHIPKILKRSG